MLLVRSSQYQPLVGPEPKRSYLMALDHRIWLQRDGYAQRDFYAPGEGLA